jgi:CRISPR system Cascade subunit CasB
MRTAPVRTDTGPIMLEYTVGALARTLASAEFPPNERAMLRRMTPGRRAPLPFLRLAYRSLPEDWEARGREWMTLAAGIALMCPHPHRPDRPTGRALAEAGFSESRLERLLAVEGDTLSAHLLRTAYFLGAKRTPVNWADFARLLLAWDEDEKESVRLQIARDFYRPLDTRHKKRTDPPCFYKSIP